ncbi:RNA-directed DNA polymerase [Chryseobacterium hispalense]|uniref:RNA-directed DNA polymerase n=1 Tax=Chryseobacterium hispalense TaxID=1453492 RepID=UPI000493A4A2|nr:RNA-directed DNA polymerase [Chryseobacterium hispalense]
MISLTQTIEAYSKLKAYVYYDNFNLFLRKQISDFEADNVDLTLIFQKLTDDINNFLLSGFLSDYLESKINEISYFIIPKSFISKGRRESLLISNTDFNNYKIEKITQLFKGSIELHIIATLWIINEGVKLQNKIGPDNYGYHLPISKSTGKIESEKLLFTKYFDKYQEWRDKGIKSAKQQIDEQNNVLLISLDIKNFFHSCSIDFLAIKKYLKQKNYSLTDLVQKICVKYTGIVGSNKTKAENDKPLLPIGLVSSGVIANWFLSDFDKELKEKTTPVYYGRYVDDIFIVVSNVEEPKKNIIRWLKDKYFYNDSPLKITEEENSGKEKIKYLSFSDEKYAGLKIQSDKLKLYYFNHEWPHAMLNKFQKTLEENSSAFWFLPEEEEMKDTLDDEAYDLRYEDTVNKFRSISEIKASKYGASVFLAKKIKLAILHNSIPDDKITFQVFRFFKGNSLLSLYNMWEKVFTYLIVTNDIKSLHILYSKILKKIEKIEVEKELDIYKNDILYNFKEYVNIALELAITLNPIVVNSITENQNFTTDKDEFVLSISNFRKSLLTRHHYLVYPFLILTNYYTHTNKSVLSNGLFNKLLKDEDFILNSELIKNRWKIPRWIYLQEINFFYILQNIKNYRSDDNLFYSKNKDQDQESFMNKYFVDSESLYFSVNNKSISKSIQSFKYKQYNDRKNKKIRIFSDTITVSEKDKNLEKIKIGLSNFQVIYKEIEKAISDKSKVYKEKRIKHIKLLNQAEEEKVDLLISPETCVPIEWLFSYSDEGRRKNRAFIFGLEHFTFKKYCFNLSVCILPFEQGKIKDSLIIPRLKNHYSPGESKEVLTYGKLIPSQSTDFYHLIKWRGIQFTLYNCYELADIQHRSIFRSELDIMFAIEYNRDINYFSNIAESVSRDLHCYFVQANTSDYGDSRIVEPRETNRMNPVRVKGGQNNVVLKYEIDIEELRKFQSKRLPYQLEDKTYKTTPPDFEHEKVKSRGK